ncbi:MAG: leucine--tRNA ligase [Candidatus Paceibacterota bacterium]|jgi:leucyl-tRNA synthetase
MNSFDFKKIEKKWNQIWKKNGVYEPSVLRAKLPFYNLMMFPYPSAEGLHVGNMYAFVGSDIYGRKKRMEGYDVFEPIGLDGFGIHSENYAIKVGIHPAKQAKISEKKFYKQLETMGNGFAWKEKLETYDSNYYKWTQWIFVQMFKKGLAYRKKQEVNWCPSCKTVLADEQVISAASSRKGEPRSDIERGECERCSTKVIRKKLEQWFFKITDYADKLLNNIDKLDWSDKVKIAQKEWIGRSDGALIDFKIRNTAYDIRIFTTRPDTLFGATYIVLSPEHELLGDRIKDLGSKVKNWKEIESYVNKAKSKSRDERIREGGEKTGVELKGIKAMNPATKKEIPIFVADYVLGSYGMGAIMAVPAHDQRDFEFAKKYKLVSVQVLDDKEHLINSGKFNGMDSKKAIIEITKLVGGKITSQFHLRDWLISRQRYWGPPIPMIFCKKCAWQPVPEKDLPIKLPVVKDFRPQGKGKSPLAFVKSFYETKCPKCGGKATRETDVSDTFLDSAWYYIGYLMVFSSWKLGVGSLEFSNIAKRWLPIDMYIGGAEHSVLHLLYIRFLAMALHDLKLVDFQEPVKKFRAHGLIIKEGAKMSKSKGNIINPDEYIKRFGADTLRTYLMFLAPFEQGGDFRDQAIIGIYRFLDRVWKFSKSHSLKHGTHEKGIEVMINQTVKKVSDDIDSLNYNTAISSLMILFNNMEKSNNVSVSQFETFIKLLSPFAPFITEEIWQKLHPCKSVHLEKWPKFNKKITGHQLSNIAVQFNGKTRGLLKLSGSPNQEEVLVIIKKDSKLSSYLKDLRIDRIIFIPGKVINIVLKP